MFLDHPSITATNAEAEPDRLDRLRRAYGHVKAQADSAGNAGFLDKLPRLHEHKSRLSVFRHAPPSAEERDCFSRAWAGKVGDGTILVEHEY